MKIVLSILVVVWSLSTNAQSDSYYLFKITYKNLLAPEEQPTAYAFIESSKLCDIQNELDTMVYPSPSIIYGITKYGGTYAWNVYMKESNYACCRYKDVSKAYSFSGYDSSALKNSGFSDMVLDDVLKGYDKYEIRITDSVETYVITCWRVRASFCKCGLFMNTPTHPIFNHDGAYVKSIGERGRFSRREKSQIAKLMNLLQKR